MPSLEERQRRAAGRQESCKWRTTAERELEELKMEGSEGEVEKRRTHARADEKKKKKREERVELELLPPLGTSCSRPEIPPMETTEEEEEVHELSCRVCLSLFSERFVLVTSFVLFVCSVEMIKRVRWLLLLRCWLAEPVTTHRPSWLAEHIACFLRGARLRV